MAQALHDATTTQYAALLDTAPIADDATVSKPLLNLPSLKVILFAMDAGQSISEHRAPYVATVHVLDGRLRFGVGGESREIAANDWLVMPPDAPHDLDAIEPTRFLLTLVKDGPRGA